MLPSLYVYFKLHTNAFLLKYGFQEIRNLYSRLSLRLGVVGALQRLSGSWRVSAIRRQRTACAIYRFAVLRPWLALSGVRVDILAQLYLMRVALKWSESHQRARQVIV